MEEIQWGGGADGENKKKQQQSSKTFTQLTYLRVNQEVRRGLIHLNYTDIKLSTIGPSALKEYIL